MQYSMHDMNKITIYIPAMQLKKIDLYCKEKKIPRSRLLVNCALSFISAKGGISCQFQNCRNPSIGKFNLTIYDWEQGEKEQTLNLCQYHFNKAKQEGTEVKELE